MITTMASEPADLLETFHVSAFQRQVLLACAEIPKGATTTYAELARRINRPHAARAVGHALASNPLPWLIPCLRVLRSDGSLGGDRFGLALKRALLEAEGAPLGASR